MNLIFSYSSEEDFRLAEAGFTFLGAAYDKKQSEVHVFQLFDLEQHQADPDSEALKTITASADKLVDHNILYECIKLHALEDLVDLGDSEDNQ